MDNLSLSTEAWAYTRVYQSNLEAALGRLTAIIQQISGKLNPKPEDDLAITEDSWRLLHQTMKEAVAANLKATAIASLLAEGRTGSDTDDYTPGAHQPGNQ